MIHVKRMRGPRNTHNGIVLAMLTPAESERFRMSGPELGQKSNNSETSVTEMALKPPFSQRFKTHMKRWWWVYVIGFCVVVLVTVLPL